jgi:hypothetical protein
LVEAISLEKIIYENNLNRIDLLKIDCEGSEYPIFYDSPPDLFECVQTIVIESHDLDDVDRNTRSLITFLEGKGFMIRSFVAENQCSYVKAYRK